MKLVLALLMLVDFAEIGIVVEMKIKMKMKMGPMKVVVVIERNFCIVFEFH